MLFFSWLPILCLLIFSENACSRWLELLFKFILSLPSCSFMPMTYSASPNPYTLFSASTSSSFSPTCYLLVGYCCQMDAWTGELTCLHAFLPHSSNFCHTYTQQPWRLGPGCVCTCHSDVSCSSSIPHSVQLINFIWRFRPWIHGLILFIAIASHHQTLSTHHLLSTHLWLVYVFPSIRKMGIANFIQV